MLGQGTAPCRVSSMLSSSCRHSKADVPIVAAGPAGRTAGPVTSSTAALPTAAAAADSPSSQLTLPFLAAASCASTALREGGARPPASAPIAAAAAPAGSCSRMASRTSPHGTPSPSPGVELPPVPPTPRGPLSVVAPRSAGPSDRIGTSQSSPCCQRCPVVPTAKLVVPALRRGVRALPYA